MNKKLALYLSLVIIICVALSYFFTSSKEDISTTADTKPIIATRTETQVSDTSTKPDQKELTIVESPKPEITPIIPAIAKEEPLSGQGTDEKKSSLSLSIVDEKNQEVELISADQIDMLLDQVKNAIQAFKMNNLEETEKISKEMEMLAMQMMQKAISIKPNSSEEVNKQNQTRAIEFAKNVELEMQQILKEEGVTIQDLMSAHEQIEKNKNN